MKLKHMFAKLSREENLVYTSRIFVSLVLAQQA